MQTRFKLRRSLLLAITLFSTVAFLATSNIFTSFFSSMHSPEPDIYPTVIIGGGIGGLTTGLNLALNGLNPIILEGTTPGGLLTLSHSVRNWPGIENTPGEKLVDQIRDHAKNAGATVKNQTAASIDCSRWPYSVTTAPDSDGNQTTYKATTIVIATGTTPRMLNIPGETGDDGYWGKGVSNCAVCDGGLYKNKPVALIGGGQAAIEEAEYLSTLAEKVYMIVRKPSFNSHEASRIKALSNNPKITVLFNTIPTGILGNGTQVTSLKIKKLYAKKESEIAVAGVFEAIGSAPNSSICRKVVSCDEQGYIKVNAFGATSHAGVFAVGDSTPTHYRQAIIVAGHAAEAAIAITNYVIKSAHHSSTKITNKTFATQSTMPSARHAQFMADLAAHPDARAAVIIGGSAAGLSAAMYLGYAGYKPLLFEGTRPGGSLKKNPSIENWPNVEKISGSELAMTLRRHALAAGTRIEFSEIASISTTSWPYIVTTEPDSSGKTQTFEALSIIIATGTPQEPSELTKNFTKHPTTNHILVSHDYQTSVPGVYAIGNSIAQASEQPVIGAGQGAEAALNACQFIRSAGYTEQDTSCPVTITKEIPKAITHNFPAEIPHLTTIKEFKRAINTGKNIIIDCFAQWCPPCKALKPVLQKIYAANEFPTVEIYAIDVDEAEELSSLLEIRSLPTLLFFSGKKEISREMGFKGESWLRNLITTSFRKP